MTAGKRVQGNGARMILITEQSGIAGIAAGTTVQSRLQAG
jgi:hypothetical protein